MEFVRPARILCFPKECGQFYLEITMKIIQLTKGNVAQVDDRWFDFLNKDKWHSFRGYAARHSPRVNGKSDIIFMHNVIKPPPDGFEVDHKDRNRSNNQEENLRYCTRTQNLQNKPPTSKNKTGYKGVSPNGIRWAAQITVCGVRHCIGTFDTPAIAAHAYDEYAKKYFGEFAYLNFPNP